MLKHLSHHDPEPIDFNYDFFNAGHLIVDANRQIQYNNQYMLDRFFGSEAIIKGQMLSRLFTQASNIFIESYVYPLLIHQQYVEEIQLSLLSASGIKMPVVANVRLDDAKNTYWSIFCCINRDKLYQELIEAKELLEIQSQKLVELATVDPLTGLLNRRELDARMRRILLRSRRTKSSIALLVVDIDFFKQINDTHRHAFGDEVLRQLSRILVKKRRDYDIIARIGGEEFVIVLPDISANFAFKIAETLRKDIESTKINGIHVTVSIGVTTNLNSGDDFEQLFKSADSALYKAKEKGRNRTVLN